MGLTCHGKAWEAEGGGSVTSLCYIVRILVGQRGEREREREIGEWREREEGGESRWSG